MPWCNHGIVFSIFTENKSVKKFLLIAIISGITVAKAQKIDSIYVNLYTDSLKKGTYNYINIDGLLSNGKYIPLDSTDIIFSASAGKFYGNSLWVDKNFAVEKITVKAVLRSNPALHKEFDIYIKKNPDNERLKTTDEILNGSNKKKKG